MWEISSNPGTGSTKIIFAQGSLWGLLKIPLTGYSLNQLRADFSQKLVIFAR